LHKGLHIAVNNIIKDVISSHLLKYNSWLEP